MSAPQPFRAAVEDGDIEAALATLSPDVVFHSPAVFHEYRGIEAVGGGSRTSR